MGMFWLPTGITLARLFAVPVTVYLLLVEEYELAFWLFVAAGISDALDGFLAKRFGWSSQIGAFLDPLADKALLVAVYVTLGHKGEIAQGLVVLIVFRDLLIIGGALLYHTLTQALTMQPLMVSKLNTAMQIVLAGVVMAELGPMVQLPMVRDVLVYTVAATTFLSGASYVWLWGRRAIDHEERTR